MNSMTGTLVATPARISSSGALQLGVELRNGSSKAVQVPSGNPFAFQAVVRDARGASVPPTQQRLEVLSATRWVRIEPGASATVALTIPPEGGNHLDTTTAVWRLPPGTYQIGGTFAVTGEDAPGDAWIGSLELAPISIEVLP